MGVLALAARGCSTSPAPSSSGTSTRWPSALGSGRRSSTPRCGRRSSSRWSARTTCRTPSASTARPSTPRASSARPPPALPIAAVGTGWVFLVNAVSATSRCSPGCRRCGAAELHPGARVARARGQLREGLAYVRVAPRPARADRARRRGRHLRAELPDHAGAGGQGGLRARRRRVRPARRPASPSARCSARWPAPAGPGRRGSARCSLAVLAFGAARGRSSGSRRPTR